MMKMDDRDSTKCQNWEKNDIIGIKGKDLNDNKTKHSIVFVFSNEKRRKREKAGDFLQKLKMAFS